MQIEPYILVMAVIGLAAMSMTWLPELLEDLPLSFPVLFVLAGFGLYSLPIELPDPQPLRYESYVVRLTELAVIVTLMGTGIKLERSFNWKNWNAPARLIVFTMIGCIGLMAVAAWGWLAMAPASAILLGAVLAPTDPVLAGDVQVGPPSEGKEDHVRFTLTAEAGLNDGMAFPFTWLAIVIAIAAGSDSGWLSTWLWRDLLYRIVVGGAMGFFIGRLLAWLVFQLPKKTRWPEAEDGFLALSATLVSYSLTEMLMGYGFIAVFVTGLTFGNFEKDHKYHKELHDFTEQIEHILVVILLIVFGGSLRHGLLDHLTWQGALLGLGFLFVIRPLTGWLALIGVSITQKEKVAISFFGIRGIGSFFYLSFALYKVNFEHAQELWSITGFVVLVSVVLHGIMATPVMKYLDLRRIRSGRKEDEFLEE